LIAHQSVLEALTATGWHEDGKLINNVNFQHGQLKREHIWIEGVAVE
jgi:antitoxin component YwqK of YwqJK toxin-antitoxin module